MPSKPHNLACNDIIPPSLILYSAQRVLELNEQMPLNKHTTDNLLLLVSTKPEGRCSITEGLSLGLVE